jgi:general stress protein 26
MLTDPIREFLRKPLIARMTTIDPDGYPHTVPVWFMLDGNDIVIIADRSTRKVGHVAANPKGSVTIGGDSTDEAGYLFKGEFLIEEDPGHAWMRKVTFHYEEPKLAAQHVAEWAELDIIVMRLKPAKVIKVM